MPVVNAYDHINEVMRETLGGLVAPDDEVRFGVGISTVHDECTEDECKVESAFEIFVALRCPESESWATAHWLSPIVVGFDDDELHVVIRDSWERVVFQRQMAAMEESSTGPD